MDKPMNPVILVTAGTAVVGLLAALSLCLKNSVSEKTLAPLKAAEAKQNAAPKAKAPQAQPAPSEQKPKKKSKPKKKAGGKGSLLQDQLHELDDDLSEDDVPTNTVQPSKINVAAKGAQQSVAAPPAPVEAAPAPAPVPVPVSAPKVSKAQKKAAAKAAEAANQSSSSSSSASVPAPAPAPAALKVPEPVKQTPPPVVPASAAVDDFNYDFSPSEHTHASDDGWNVVEDKRKVKAQSKPKAASAKETSPSSSAAAGGAEGAAAAPVGEAPITSQVTVDSKRVGVIIGPKGATLKQIQEVAGVELQTPKDKDAKPAGAAADAPVSITVTGPASGVALASRIISDLNTKGYSADLEGEDFSEAHMMLHPSAISDIIGKGGAVRKAIQDHSGVRIGVPANVPRDQTAPVKVTLAGIKGKVTEAKKIIKEIIKHKHHPVTHPNFIHAEVEVPTSMYNIIIGAKGSEIKQMQNNHGVSVHIPNENSVVKNVLVVGPQKGVDGAVAHIARLLEKATRDRTAVVDVVESWAEDAAAAAADAPQEEWMDQYTHPSQRKPKPAAAAAGATAGASPAAGGTSPAPAAASSSSAAGATTNWAGVITNAEGW